MEHCWILIGMMGVGKSAVGRELAARTGRQFMDTDQLLQNRLGRPISQLFNIYGEAAFRDHETAILRMLEPSHAILSTGGGIVVTEANWPELKRLGVVMYLKAKDEEIIQRLTNSKKRRPLLEVENWQDRLRSLIEQREPMYQRADIVVELNGDCLENAAERAYNAFVEATR